MKFVLFFVLMISSFTIYASSLVEKDLALLKETSKVLLPTMNDFRERIIPIMKKTEDDSSYILSLSENDSLNDFWTTYHNARVVLGVLQSTYKDEKNNPDAAFIYYLSSLLLHNSATEIVVSVWDNDIMRKKLDMTNPKEVPQGTFHSMENEIFDANLGDKTIKRIPTFFEMPDIKLARDTFNQHLLRFAPTSPLVDELNPILKDQEKLRKKYRSFIEDSMNVLTLGWRNLQYTFYEIYYDLFAKISTWIGDTKVFRQNSELHYGDTFISKKLANDFLNKLNSGDLVIGRGNWFLSNAFMVGFWPHSTIYLGNATKLKKSFDNDQEVQDYFTTVCRSEGIVCYNLSTYLEASKRTKEAWSDYLIPDSHGDEKVMIEATSDGVILSSVYGYMADFLAGMRPLLGQVDKAKAIVESFKRFGLPYDFDFDLRNEDRLVCSALLDKSYRPEPLYGKQGIHFETNYTTKLGRPVLPPNNIVVKAFEENVLAQRAKELVFVAFLKGDKASNSAIFADEKTFYQSRLWPRWSFMQNE